MMDRRDFIKLMAATTAVAADGSKLFADDAQKKQEDKMKVPERNRRPYSDVDWEHSLQIHTTSHGHCTSQGMMDGYLKRGFGLLTLSNYYPSAPYCPASKMTVNYYRVHHDKSYGLSGYNIKLYFHVKYMSSSRLQVPERKNSGSLASMGFPLY